MWCKAKLAEVWEYRRSFRVCPVVQQFAIRLMRAQLEWKERRDRAHEWAEAALLKLAKTPTQVHHQLAEVHDPTIILGSLVNTSKSSLHSNDNPCCQRHILQELEAVVVNDVAKLVWQYAAGYWVNVNHGEQITKQQSLTKVEYMRLLAYAHANAAYNLMMRSHGVARGVKEAAAQVDGGPGYYFGDWAAALERVREDYASQHRHEPNWNVKATRYEIHDSVDDNMTDEELGVKLSHYTGATAIVVTPKARIEQGIQTMNGFKTYQRLQSISEPDAIVLYDLDSSSAYGHIRGDTGFAVHIYP